MGFETYVAKENLVAKADVYDKATAIAFMVGHVSQTMQFDTVAMTKLLLTREQKKSSGIGKEMAIIHSINPIVPDLRILICTFKNPINWDSTDQKPVKAAAMILAPSRFINEYFALMLEMCKVLADETVKTSLTNMHTAAQMMTVLNSAKGKYA